MTRTLRLGHTTLVVEHILAWRVTPDVQRDGMVTSVWVRDVNISFVLEGNHADALARAVEALHA